MIHIISLLLGLLLLVPVTSAALEPAFYFDRLTTDDGLSHSWVWSIYTDSQGFMWFGTPDGLNRYDGYGFQVFENDPADPHSLSLNEVTSIQ